LIITVSAKICTKIDLIALKFYFTFNGNKDKKQCALDFCILIEFHFQEGGILNLMQRLQQEYRLKILMI
jgi:hypothetical protein